MSCFMGSRTPGGLNYTVPVSEGVKGESAILRGKNGAAGLYSDREDLLTCTDIFRHGMAVSGPAAPCLGYREVLPNGGFGEYKWVTYGEVDARSCRLSTGLENLNLAPEILFSDETVQNGKFRFLCLYAKNRVEWNLLELAANRCGVTVVPMYDTLGVDGLKFISEQTKFQTIVCSALTIKHVIALKTQNPQSHIGNIIMLDPLGAADLDSLKALNVRVLSLEEVENATTPTAAAAAAAEKAAQTADSVCLLMYTSGTTGNPKGVIMTSRMFCSMLPKLDIIQFPLISSDCLLSYLPSAHVFDRMTAYGVYLHGGRIGFSCGDITKILEDCEKLQPTLFPAVPRVLNRFHGKIWDGIRQKPGFLQSLISMAVNAKLKALDEGISTGEKQFNHWLWDSIIFKKFKSLLGGKVRIVVCGAAPISPQVLREFRVFFSCPVMEVYGMTETTGGGCMTYDADPAPNGGVGAPNTECELKLVSVPEMNYHADGSQPEVRGEICFRGPCVTPGYFRAAELTREAKDADNWLRTGDVGELMDNGGIKVIDRKKNIFKLAQGEYLCPEKIEQIYLRAPAVGQVFLYGDSNEVYPVAVVVVDDDWKKRNQELCADGDKLKQEVKKQMDVVASEAKLHGFEKAKDILIAPEAFTVENNLLTPTMKIRRHDAKLKYLNQLNEMYATLKNGTTSN